MGITQKKMHLIRNTTIPILPIMEEEHDVIKSIVQCKLYKYAQIWLLPRKRACQRTIEILPCIRVHVRYSPGRQAASAHLHSIHRHNQIQHSRLYTVAHTYKRVYCIGGYTVLYSPFSFFLRFACFGVGLHAMQLCAASPEEIYAKKIQHRLHIILEMFVELI